MTALQFVRCRDCEELFRPSPLDRAPEYYLTDDGPIAEVRDDCMAFLTRHARHKLETLRPTATPAAHDGAVADPMARTVWEVSNGEDVVLVQSWRESMREPLRYRGFGSGGRCLHPWCANLPSCARRVQRTPRVPHPSAKNVLRHTRRALSRAAALLDADALPQEDGERVGVVGAGAEACGDARRVVFVEDFRGARCELRER